MINSTDLAIFVAAPPSANCKAGRGEQRQQQSRRSIRSGTARHLELGVSDGWKVGSGGINPGGDSDPKLG